VAAIILMRKEYITTKQEKRYLKNKLNIKRKLLKTCRKRWPGEAIFRLARGGRPLEHSAVA
jgi:hypothetical protein